MCKICRTRLITHTGKGRKPRYCSDKCKQKSYRERQKRNANYPQKALRNSRARFSRDSAEWYTPLPYITAVHDVLGTIELDPASCTEANTTVQAERFFDSATNGLMQCWQAQTLFLNPPHDKTTSTSTWIAKFLAEYTAGHIQEAILLVDAATDTGWFHHLSRFPICFLKGRIRFSTNNGTVKNSPTNASAFIYVGRQVDRFYAVFSQFDCFFRFQDTD